jgi:5-methyltetrahydropteroyltriglutamate--homocysteine methyltransferase
MPVLTTTIGAYPKPSYLALPDWFSVEGGPDTSAPTGAWAGAMAAMGDEAEKLLARAAHEVVGDQVSAGVDIPTDGEVRRENYIHYHCRHLHGFDFEKLTEKLLRNGAYSAQLPTVRGAISVRDTFAVHDWRVAQAATDKTVKITLPGPLTVSDTVADAFYNDPKRFGEDMADALNVEVRALADAGCRYIQIDEPLFARKPQAAMDYGIANLERAFAGVGPQVVRTMHMCCGYPDRLDNPDYPKADPGAYLDLAAAVDGSCVDAVSIEDAHRHNPLTLLDGFSNTTVIFGVIGVVRSRIETVEEVAGRLRAALDHIDADRLIAAPDCGLGLLTREMAQAKLTIMCEAARQV